MVGRGSQRVMRRRIRSQRTRPFWLRRESARCQSRPTWNRKIHSAFWFRGTRSEEHTSELQSRSDLVCRLLLEKKKTHKIKQLSPNSSTHPTSAYLRETTTRY